MKELIEKLDKAIRDLVNECGTDICRIRCDLYDVSEKLKAYPKQGDEYDIVREFIEWNRDRVVENVWFDLLKEFIKHRAKHTVTLDKLKECYAKAEGIEVDKIEVKENK